MSHGMRSPLKTGLSSCRDAISIPSPTFCTASTNHHLYYIFTLGGNSIRYLNLKSKKQMFFSVYTTVSFLGFIISCKTPLQS
jgi:hypothetical protein